MVAASCIAAVPFILAAAGTSPASAAPASAAPGSLDPSFGQGGLVLDSQVGSGATGVAVEPGSGDVVVSCCQSAGKFEVDVYSPSGAKVWSSTPLSGAAYAVAVRPSDGEIVAAGYVEGPACGSADKEPVVVGFTASGQLNIDQTISCATGASEGQLNGVAIAPDGSIVAAGQEVVAGRTEMLEVALTPTGAIASTTVQPVGSANSVAQAVTVAPGGDAIVAGSAGSQLAVAAFGSTGGLDPSFGTAGVVTPSPGTGMGVTIGPGGDIVVAGDNGAGSSLITELTSTGATVNQFGALGGYEFNSVAYQPLGNVLVAAGQVGSGQSEHSVVAELDASTGAPNSSFATTGGVDTFGASHSSVAGVAVESDGKVVTAGEGPVVNAVQGEMVARLLGPTLSIGTIPLFQVTRFGPVVLTLPLYLDEPLFAPVAATVCGSPGEIVAGQGQCAQVQIPAGRTSIGVPVTVQVTAPVGSEETAAVSVGSGGGMAASPSQAYTTVLIQHIPPPPPAPGYWLVASDGGIFSFGQLNFYGSTGAVHLNQPIVGMAATPDDRGYWLVASDGGIFTFGDAQFYGSTGAVHLNKPIVGMAATPDGHGYWLVASDGGIFSFGDANFYGSTGAVHLNKPIVGMASTADGGGYWLVASDGGIFTFGDAAFEGSTGAIALNKPIVGMAPYPGGPGYWLVASDGGIFSFGAASFHGSTGAIALNKPIVGMEPTYNGQGYWLVASDGGIFTFGDAAFEGSTGAIALNKPIVGMAG